MKTSGCSSSLNEPLNKAENNEQPNLQVSRCFLMRIHTDAFPQKLSHDKIKEEGRSTRNGHEASTSSKGISGL